MAWRIEHKDGRTNITHNGKQVHATVLDFHAEVGHPTTAIMRVLFLNDDHVDLQMKQVTVTEESIYE